ncbi:MAG: LPXTG cell wall anchor domain-containing protein [Roseiflexaceae bacterium]
MSDRQTQLSWPRSFLIATAIAALSLALLYLLVLYDPPAARAQAGTLSMAITKQLDGSPVVTVGQYIDFTIRITNTGTISITKLPVIDTYDANVLRFDQANPPPSTIDNGQLTWTTLPTDTLGGPLQPGQTITIKAHFRVIGISDMTINRARIQDAVGQGGQSGGDGSDQSGGKTEGGRVVIEKSQEAGLPAQSGHPVTFTITVRNEGAADLVKVPIQDSYQAEYLQFWKAAPPPSQLAPGQVSWEDVLPQLGLTRLRPNEALTITTVFTALKALDNGVINRAGATGLRDEFQNELPAPRQAEVPIRIIAGPSTAQPTATATPKPRSNPKQATPTLATPSPDLSTPATSAITTTTELTATVGVTVSDSVSTPTLAPASLPRTGTANPSSAWLMIALTLIVGGALALLYRRVLNR